MDTLNNDYDAALEAGLDDLGDMMPADLLAGVSDHLAAISGNLPGPDGMGGDYLEDAEAAAAAALAAQALADQTAAADTTAAATVVATPEPVAVEPAAPVVEPAKKEHMIPKSRLDQEIEKRRAAEARAIELENQRILAERAAQPAFQLGTHDEAMKLYHDAILDNKLDEAAKIMTAIRTADAAAIAQQTAEQVRAELRHEARVGELNTAVAELEAAHDVLNAKSEAYDADLTQEVLDLHELYMRRGFTPADSIRKAAGMVLKTTGQAAAPATAVTTPAAAAVATQTLEAAAIVAQRAAQARTQAAALATQPTAVPARSDMSPPMTLDILNMSDEDFAALPESKLREMRGDFALGR